MDRRRPRKPPDRSCSSLNRTKTLDTTALSADGFDVVAVGDGVDAYREAFAIRPDSIVTDLPMPNFDGWQFLQCLKGIRARQGAIDEHDPIG